eukprot:scaffold2859_cov349-Pavlova_lutheri.AAC.41
MVKERLSSVDLLFHSSHATSSTFVDDQMPQLHSSWIGCRFGEHQYVSSSLTNEKKGGPCHSTAPPLAERTSRKNASSKSQSWVPSRIVNGLRGPSRMRLEGLSYVSSIPNTSFAGATLVTGPWGQGLRWLSHGILPLDWESWAGHDPRSRLGTRGKGQVWWRSNPCRVGTRPTPSPKETRPWLVAQGGRDVSFRLTPCEEQEEGGGPPGLRPWW